MNRLFTEISGLLGVPSLHRVGGAGGDINEGALVEGGGGRWFVKWNRRAPPGFFAAEAAGLEELRAAGTSLIIPKPLAWADRGGEVPAYLLLEQVELGSDSHSGATMGRGLAELHSVTSSHHGGHADNFIGTLRQLNPDTVSWPEFYRDARIRPQVDLGVRSGRIPSSLACLLDALCVRMSELLPESRPSLLHGDLWGGNWSGVRGGGASIYDPAIYYGSSEVDLAMSELFGGFPSSFYAAYDSVRGVPAGYEERRPLLQLYPVLVHVNLFGGGYVGQARRIVERYL